MRIIQNNRSLVSFEVQRLNANQNNWISRSQSRTSKLSLRLVAGDAALSSLLVFVWHNLIEGNDNSQQIGLSRSIFESQLRWLHTHFDILSLEEGIERCHLGGFDRPSACLTFDDGYRSHLDIGVPILNELGIPASFFITSGMLHNNILWNDLLRKFLNWATPTERTTFIERLTSIEILESGIASAKGSTDRDLEHRIKYLPLSARSQALQDTSMQDGQVDRDMHDGNTAMLDEDGVRALLDSGFEIGGHTLSHPILALESEHEGRNQIASDLSCLGTIAGRTITTFAFPNGLPSTDYTTAHVEILRSLGVRIALTSAFGSYRPKRDVLQVPRIGLSGNSSIGWLRQIRSAYKTKNIPLA